MSLPSAVAAPAVPTEAQINAAFRHAAALRRQAHELQARADETSEQAKDALHRYESGGGDEAARAERMVAAGALAPELGERLQLVPGHVDPTFNLYDWVVAVRDGRVESVWPVEARGAVG